MLQATLRLIRTCKTCRCGASKGCEPCTAGFAELSGRPEVLPIWCLPRITVAKGLQATAQRRVCTAMDAQRDTCRSMLDLSMPFVVDNGGHRGAAPLPIMQGSWEWNQRFLE